MANIFKNIGNLKSTTDRLRNAVRDVENFPSEGVVFKDITPLLNDPQLFRLSISLLADRYQRMRIDKVMAIDARGFLFGSALAYVLGTGVAIARKKGKLPWETIEASYDLEYGSNTIEIHKDAVLSGERVLVVDDVLATGGTLKATIDLVQELGGEVVESAVIIELLFLNGAEKIKPSPLYSLIDYS
ncbi:MAG: adenine phosphoribosyltransferase [Verrucomicrobiota bacterium]